MWNYLDCSLNGEDVVTNMYLEAQKHYWLGVILNFPIGEDEKFVLQLILYHYTNYFFGEICTKNLYFSIY